MKATQSSIQPFLQPGRIALAGASRNEKKFGNQLYKLLNERGFEVIPVNPNAEKIGEVQCLSSVSEIPADINRLIVVTPKNQTAMVIDLALTGKFDHIWIQQMSETPEVIEKIEKRKEKRENIVTGECLMMYLEPVKGPHKFHRFIRTLFGRMPK